MSGRPAVTLAPLPARIAVAPDLLEFERNGQLLLVDGATLSPLLVNRGLSEIRALLKRIDSVRHSDTLLAEGAPESLLRVMLEHGVLIAEDRPPVVEPRVRPMREGDRTGGMSLYLLLAQDCNLGCVYCLNGEETYHRSENRRMSPEVAFRAIEGCLERIEPGGSLQIVFFGGEPLLNWELAKQIIDEVESGISARFPDRNCHFHLTSNLAKIPDDLVERAKAHGISVLCDIDGPPGVHDATRPMKGGQPSCERISKNVRTLVQAGVPVALRATVTSRNVEYMADIARYHKALGGCGSSVVAVNAVNSDEDILDAELLPDLAVYAEGLREMLDTGWDPQQLFPFNQIGSQIRPNARVSIACGAPYGNTPVVDAEGDIYACIYLVGLSAYKTGSVFSDAPFPDPEVVQRMTDLVHIDNVEGCRECAYRYVCAGGCPVGTLSVAANPNATEDVKTYQREVRCKTVQVAVEETLWRVAEQAGRAMDSEPGGMRAPC